MPRLEHADAADLARHMGFSTGAATVGTPAGAVRGRRRLDAINITRCRLNVVRVSSRPRCDTQPGTSTLVRASAMGRWSRRNRRKRSRGQSTSQPESIGLFLCESGGRSHSLHLCAVLPNVRIMEIDIDDMPWKGARVTKPPKICDGHIWRPRMERRRRREGAGGATSSAGPPLPPSASGTPGASASAAPRSGGR